MTGARLEMALGLALALALALAIATTGCGGGDTTGQADPLAGFPKGPTREFIVPRGDNAVQEFGREATATERRRVSRMVEAWLRARVRGDWTEACAYLHEKVAVDAVELGSTASGRRLTRCSEGLAALTKNAEPPRDNIEGGVASLRIEAGEGFAQYHGREGRDWVLAVRRENGTWKVAHFYPIERFK